MTERERKQEAIIEEQETQIQLLTEKVNYLTKKLFGKSSEKIKYGDGQLNLFGDDFFMKQRQL